MRYSEFSWFNIFVIVSLVQGIKFFVTDHPLIVGLLLFALVLLFRIKLMIGYPLLAVFLVMVFVFILMAQTFWAFLIYYMIEGLFWWYFLFAVKDWLQSKG